MYSFWTKYEPAYTVHWCSVNHLVYIWSEAQYRMWRAVQRCINESRICVCKATRRCKAFVYAEYGFRGMRLTADIWILLPNVCLSNEITHTSGHKHKLWGEKFRLTSNVWLFLWAIPVINMPVLCCTTYFWNNKSFVYEIVVIYWD